MPIPADLTICSDYLITMAPGDRALKKDHALAIEGSTIIDLGPRSEITGRYQSLQTINLGKKLLMPGMVNTHGHIPMTGYCGKMPDGLPFNDILFNYMLPLEREFILRRDFVYLCTLLGCRELAMGGVTTTVEMYYEAREMIRAFTDAGIRAVVGETLMSEFPSPSQRSPGQVFDYIRMVNGEMPRGERLVELAVAPHSAYACDDDALTESARLAAELNIPLLMHARETPDEMERAREGAVPSPSSFYRIRPGVEKNPLVHLESLGFFEAGRVLLAHCIYLEDDELDILAHTGAGASYNGICNAQIGLASAPVTRMREKGIAVGLGTDGPLTNDHLDLVSQLLPLLCFQRQRMSSGHVLSCYDMVQMATLEGARAIGMAESIGSLEKGKKADIIAFNLEAHPRWPLYLENDAVYTFIAKNLIPGQVDFCLINGKMPSIGSSELLMERLGPLLEDIRAWEPGN